MKSRIEDLQGLLAFLRVEPFGASRGALSRLIEEVPTFIRGEFIAMSGGWSRADL